MPRQSYLTIEILINTSKMVGNSEDQLLGNNVAKLSQRQRQCLELAGDGLTSKEIARSLNISPSTVDNHIQAACDRLGAKNRTDAVRIYRDDPSSEKLPKALPKLGLFSFPPIGGQVNDLPKSQRIFHILQISVFAIIGVSAAILTIAGVVHILAGPE